MSNQSIYVESGVIREIGFCPEENNWYNTEAVQFNEDKAIPFLKLLTDLIGASSKYHRNQARMGRYENYPPPPLAVGILKTASKLACSFQKTQELTDNLYCTGDIQTIYCCLEVYRQYKSGEQFDYFLWNG